MKDVQNPKLVIDVAETLRRRGFSAYLVGGASRDAITGNRVAADIDMATSAPPDELISILQSRGYDLDLHAKRFGSISVKSKTTKPVEITSFREESGYSDSRHPDTVRFIDDAEKDAHRRDFTVNAIYLDPLKEEVIDPTDGRRDLKSKLIRLIGNPKKKIDEDHLRMIRAVRLAAQLDFKLERNTYAAIKTRAKLITTVSADLIKDELDKILLAQNAISGIRLLDEIGLLRFVLPELYSLKNVYHKSKTYHLEGSVFEHSLLALNEIKEPDLPTRYAALLHDVGKGVTGKLAKKNEGWVMRFLGHDKESVRLFLEVAKRLRFPKKMAKTVAWLIENNRFWPDFENLPTWKKLNLVKSELFPELMAVWQADAKSNLNLLPDGRIGPHPAEGIAAGKKFYKTYLNKIRLIEKFCDGDSIMEHSKGLRGKKFSSIVERITGAVMSGEIQSDHDYEKFFRDYTKNT